jgi:hypothetical protein
MKKVMIPFIALLVLFAVTTVMAEPATKIPFTAYATLYFGNVSPGKVWITDDGVYHVKGAVSQGNVTLDSILGEMEGILIMVHDLTIDQNTGLGDCHGKCIITVPEAGTFEGSEHGSHMITTDGHYISGGLVAKGTGVFDGVKMKSSYEGEIHIEGSEQVMDAVMEGTLLSPNR